MKTLMCNHFGVRLLERSVPRYVIIMEAGLLIVLVGVKQLQFVTPLFGTFIELLLTPSLLGMRAKVVSD